MPRPPHSLTFCVHECVTFLDNSDSPRKEYEFAWHPRSWQLYLQSPRQDQGVVLDCKIYLGKITLNKGFKVKNWSVMDPLGAGSGKATVQSPGSRWCHGWEEMFFTYLPSSRQQRLFQHCLMVTIFWIYLQYRILDCDPFQDRELLVIDISVNHFGCNPT